MAVNLQKTTENTMTTIKKWSIWMVYYIQILLKDQTEMLLFALLSPALSFTFSDLDTLCWGTFLIY